MNEFLKWLNEVSFNQMEKALEEVEDLDELEEVCLDIKEYTLEELILITLSPAYYFDGKEIMLRGTKSTSWLNVKKVNKTEERILLSSYLPN